MDKKRMIAVPAILCTAATMLMLGAIKYAADCRKEARVYSSEYLYMNSLVPATFEKKVHSGETFMALIARPECEDCRAISEDVMDFVIQNELEDELYYVNVESVRESADDPLWLRFKREYGNISGTPAFLSIRNGKVVSKLMWKEGSEKLTLTDMNDWLDACRASEQAEAVKSKNIM